MDEMLYVVNKQMAMVLEKLDSLERSVGGSRPRKVTPKIMDQKIREAQDTKPGRKPMYSDEEKIQLGVEAIKTQYEKEGKIEISKLSDYLPFHTLTWIKALKTVVGDVSPLEYAYEQVGKRVRSGRYHKDTESLI